jgi:hypothetical protein
MSEDEYETLYKQLDSKGQTMAIASCFRSYLEKSNPTAGGIFWCYVAWLVLGQVLAGNTSGEFVVLMYLGGAISLVALPVIVYMNIKDTIDCNKEKKRLTSLIREDAEEKGIKQREAEFAFQSYVEKAAFEKLDYERNNTIIYPALISVIVFFVT